MRISDLHRRILAQSQPLLLDLFPNASAAYSLRKLRTSYTGNCIEVRRSSDNALQNIGFVNNVLDTASLLSFVGAGSGFVRTWYDQSSNINVSQTTTTMQPRIVLNSVLETQNGKPTIFFDGVDDFLFIGSNSLFRNSQYGHGFDVHRIRSNYTSNRNIFSIGAGPSGTTRYSGGGGSIVNKDYIFARRLDGLGGQTLSSISNSDILNNVVFSRLVNWINASAFLYKNSFLENSSLSFLTAGNTSDTNSFQFNIGAGVFSNFGQASAYKDVNFAELIIYNIDQSSNRTAIETNINSFYNIY